MINLLSQFRVSWCHRYLALAEQRSERLRRTLRRAASADKLRVDLRSPGHRRFPDRADRGSSALAQLASDERRRRSRYWARRRPSPRSNAGYVFPSPRPWILAQPLRRIGRGYRGGRSVDVPRTVAPSSTMVARRVHPRTSSPSSAIDGVRPDGTSGVPSPDNARHLATRQRQRRRRWRLRGRVYADTAESGAEVGLSPSLMWPAALLIAVPLSAASPRRSTTRGRPTHAAAQPALISKRITYR